MPSIFVFVGFLKLNRSSFLQNHESPLLGHCREHCPRHVESLVRFVSWVQLGPSFGSLGRSWFSFGKPHTGSLPFSRNESQLASVAVTPTHDFLHCLRSFAVGRLG